jgi:hypothetical protein
VFRGLLACHVDALLHEAQALDAGVAHGAETNPLVTMMLERAGFLRKACAGAHPGALEQGQGVEVRPHGRGSFDPVKAPLLDLQLSACAGLPTVRIILSAQE